MPRRWCHTYYGSASIELKPDVELVEFFRALEPLALGSVDESDVAYAAMMVLPGSREFAAAVFKHRFAGTEGKYVFLTAHLPLSDHTSVWIARTDRIEAKQWICTVTTNPTFDEKTGDPIRTPKKLAKSTIADVD